MNLVTLLRRQACRRPGTTALVETHRGRRRTCTFGELEERSARAAARLQTAGLEAGDLVLVAQPLSIDLYVTLAAIFRAGLVAMVPDVSADRDQLAAACDRWPPAAFAGPPRAHLLRLLVPAVRRIPQSFTTGHWSLPGTPRLQVGDLPPADVLPRDHDAAALVTSTSGTTGKPKVAVRTHGLLLHQYEALRDTLDLRPGQIDLAMLPIFVLANLAAGVTTILPDADLRDPGAIDPLPVLDQIRHERPTRLTASPAILETLLDASLPSDFHSLHRIDTGGGPVFPDLLLRLRCAAPHADIVAVYGSTEAEPIAHAATSALSESDWRRMSDGRGLIAGHPAEPVQVCVLPDRWGTPVGPFTRESFDAAALPADQRGEIVVSGPHVLPGYLDGHGDQENKFDVDGTRWHRTGDAGYFDDEGRLWLLGRCAAQIDDAHGRLYPLGVESATRSVDGVRRATVVSVAGRRVLVVEPDDRGHRPDAGVLMDRIAWAHIDDIQMVERLPMDRRHAAKVDHDALRRLMNRDALASSGRRLLVGELNAPAH